MASHRDMEYRLIESFGFKNVGEFNDMLQATGAVIAGSAALAMVAPIFEPADMDIWIHSFSKKEDAHGHKAMTMLFKYFMGANGYFQPILQTHNPSTEGYASGKLHDVIARIDRYINGRKVVQVIHTFVPVADAIKAFDLSVCQISWNGRKLESPHMIDIDSRICYIMHKTDPSTRELERIHKYIGRGFKLHGHYKEPEPEIM